MRGFGSAHVARTAVGLYSFLLMPFSQFLMDSLVSNFAHCAHGIVLDQLSLWSLSVRLAFEDIPLYLCVVRLVVSWRLCNADGDPET